MGYKSNRFFNCDFGDGVSNFQLSKFEDPFIGGKNA
jgi:hypothetical protein